MVTGQIDTCITRSDSESIFQQQLVNTMDMTAANQYILTASQSLRPGETGQHCLPDTIVCFCVISYGQSTHVAI